jgi:hypothetical protein
MLHAEHLWFDVRFSWEGGVVPTHVLLNASSSAVH